MKNQVYNPFLPLTEYIPDGEPHVFGDRVYLYGSHDKAGAERFCVQDYTVWSAPVTDLSDWSCHGVTYRKDQDLRAKQGKLPDYYAPDCVQGNDGKFYLYYSAMGPNVQGFGPMSVAVSDGPGGPFDYLGDIQYPDGTPVLRYMNNDPAVLNDNGRIWLYYGWGLGRDFRNKLMAPMYDKVLSKISGRSIEEVRDTKPSILSCAVVELETDMLTVKWTPKAVLDSMTTAQKGTLGYKYPFYEAPSIRKVGELYYLIYSCSVDNALAYATSKYPDRDFEVRGAIISNTDLGLNGNRQKKAAAGTIHGSFECINGQYYIFYHRSTHNTEYSRQACAEPIEILPDGTIPQVEITSCGLNGGPLEGKGDYPAAICCHLYGKVVPELGLKEAAKHRRIFEADGEVFVHDVDDGTIIGYKYFKFDRCCNIAVTMRGTAKGVLEVLTDPEKEAVGQIPVEPADAWHSVTAEAALPDGKSALYLRYVGNGKCDLLTIGFSE